MKNKITKESIEEMVYKVLKLKKEALNNPKYKKIVSNVVEKYKIVNNINKKEVSSFIKNLHGAWSKMKKDVKEKISSKK